MDYHIGKKEKNKYIDNGPGLVTSFFFSSILYVCASVLTATTSFLRFPRRIAPEITNFVIAKQSAEAEKRGRIGGVGKLLLAGEESFQLGLRPTETH